MRKIWPKLLIAWLWQVTTILIMSQGVGISKEEQNTLAGRTHELQVMIESEEV